MKKTSFWMLMLLLGLSCALWTGCSDDDDDTKKDDTEMPPVAKDSLWVVNTIKINSVEAGREGFYKQVDLKRDAAGVVTEIKMGNYTPKGQNGAPVVYPVQFEAGKVTIAFNDPNAGDMINLYTLNAKGYVTNVKRSYTDGLVEVEYSFKYDEKDQLKEIDALADMDDDGVNEEIPFFKTTYVANGNLGNCMLAPDQGEGAVMGNCALSGLNNNYSFDLNLMLLTNLGFYSADLVECAVYLGLLPKTPNVLASVKVEGLPDFVITSGVKEKRIESLKMTGFCDMVLTTVLKETEKK
ncbi:MAG: hypothetical protein RR137_10440 [Odoribacter sp.]